MSLKPVQWCDGVLRILDQRELPLREVWIEARSWQDVAEAIRNMSVRGAPLIGITAAYGMALAQAAGDNLLEAKRVLADTRPTAVNLFWALSKVADASNMLAAAVAIEQAEVEANDRIAKYGAELIEPNSGVLTICNTGSLATAGVGTALGIIRKAHSRGTVREVFSCESRPRMQGLRLTAYELSKDGIPFRSIADGAAASLIQRGDVDIVVAGADRIAANGDSANKIGTYSLAVLANFHNIPFVIAAPQTTIDSSLETGEFIPIEERSADELTTVDGVRVAPDGCPVWNPAFDVTPARLITNIVTDLGVHAQPYDFTKVLAS